MSVAGKSSVPSAASSGSHIPALDGVRGIAVLAVLLSSVVEGQQLTTRAGAFFIKTLGAGWWGVNLFFVLSGFLITGILLRTKDGPNYLRNFYGRRALRVFPLYFALLTLALVIVPLFVHSDPASSRQMAAGQWWLWTYLSNVPIAFHNDWWQFKGQYFSFGHTWSLAVEEHFYLFWPFVVLMCSPKRLVHVCLLLIVFALAARCWCMFAINKTVAGFVFTACRVDGLALGALLAVGLRHYPRVRGWRAAGVCVALGGGVALLGMLLLRPRFSSTDPFIGTIGISLLDWFSAGLLFVAVTSTGWVGRAFSFGPLRGFGRYSYSIYLLNPSLHHVYNMGFSVDILTPWCHSTFLAIIVHAVLLLCCAYMAAVVTWYLLEWNFLRLKRYFETSHAPAPSPVVPDPSSTATLPSPQVAAVSHR